MSRQESDKEDLMAEATALVERAEFARASDTSTHPGWTVVTAGFRSDHSLSLYFDQDPFYQFDSAGRLRRSYEAGFLFRSTGDTLARLQRTRTEARTTLLRHDLSADELRDFRDRMRLNLTNFFDRLSANSLSLLRVVPTNGDIKGRLIEAVQAVLNQEPHFLSQTIRVRRNV